MNTKGWTLLKTLLNKHGHKLPPQEFKTIFLSDLPDEETNKILDIKAHSSNPEAIIHFPEESLRYIHYSWLIPALEKMPSFLQKPLLSLIPSGQQEKILEKTTLIPSKGSYLESIKKMIINIFFKKMDTQSVLPKEFLPEGPLNPLLNLSKENIVTLIDLLGIHDLAEEMRSIVDQKIIKAVYLSLKPHQHRHLYLCLHQQERFSAPPLDLSGWNGSAKTLQKKLHVRGLVRLAKALSGQSPDLIWHISHILDTGRASILKQHLLEEGVPKITPALQQQVIQTLNYVNSKS